MTRRYDGGGGRSEGQRPSKMVQCRVMNVNLVNYTVDCISQFDRHYYYDIQVSSPYMHYNSGEGIFVMPDVGAVCFVCIPSDSSPPFVNSFIMPMQQAGNTSKPLGNPDDAITTSIKSNQLVDQGDLTGTDAPQGTRSRSGKVEFPHNDARFDGGRPEIKPGDVFMKGRDGNFVILHRGGVLQIGGSSLAQRIYIPLANKIFDVSGDYEHQNVGGAIKWGIQEGPSIDNPAAQHMETYRLFANDQFCDIRIAKGKVLNPVTEPPKVGSTFFGDSTSDLQNAGIGTTAPVVMEVVIAPGGFKAGTGDLANPAVAKQMTMHFIMDRAGGVFIRSEGGCVIDFKKGLSLKGAGSLSLAFDNAELKAKTSMVVGGQALTEVSGDQIRLGSGTQPVARMGDSVAIVIPVAQVSGLLNGSPFTGVITIATPAVGSITTGNPAVMALRCPLLSLNLLVLFPYRPACPGLSRLRSRCPRYSPRFSSCSQGRSGSVP